MLAAVAVKRKILFITQPGVGHSAKGWQDFDGPLGRPLCNLLNYLIE